MNEADRCTATFNGRQCSCVLDAGHSGKHIAPTVSMHKAISAVTWSSDESDPMPAPDATPPPSLREELDLLEKQYNAAIAKIKALEDEAFWRQAEATKILDKLKANVEMRGFTDTETAWTMEYLVRAFDHFTQTDTTGDDARNFCDAIHTCQRILMARAFASLHPKDYPHDI